MLSNFKYLNGTIRKNWYPKHTVPILVGKQATNCTNLISALVLNGPSTTRDLAKFVLRNTSTYEYHVNPSSKDTQKLERRYYNLINGRLRKKTGRKKSSEKYPGLLEKGFIIKTGKRRTGKRVAPLYFLTLKGCFFCFGFEYDEDELKLFIKNAARNHLLFAFLDELPAKTDISFVCRIFFSSVRYIIKQGKIFLDDNISFYFTNFAETFGNAIYDELSVYVIGASANWPKRKLDDYPDFKNFETLQSLVFYNKDPRSDWSRSVIEFYYRTEEEIEFYLSYCNGFDMSFFYKVMREIHHAYFSTFGFGLPERSHRRLPYSSHAKDLRKLKKRQLSQKLF